MGGGGYHKRQRGNYIKAKETERGGMYIKNNPMLTYSKVSRGIGVGRVGIQMYLYHMSNQSCPKHTNSEIKIDSKYIFKILVIYKFSWTINHLREILKNYHPLCISGRVGSSENLGGGHNIVVE